MNRFQNRHLSILGILSLFTLCLLLFPAEAAGLRSEMTGTRKVMKVIHTVNLPRNDQKAFQDILDIKGQIYSQNPLLTPTAAITRPPASRLNNPKELPQRTRSPYRR